MNNLNHQFSCKAPTLQKVKKSQHMKTNIHERVCSSRQSRQEGQEGQGRRQRQRLRLGQEQEVRRRRRRRRGQGEGQGRLHEGVHADPGARGDRRRQADGPARVRQEDLGHHQGEEALCE